MTAATAASPPPVSLLPRVFNDLDVAVDHWSDEEAETQTLPTLHTVDAGGTATPAGSVAQGEKSILSHASEAVEEEEEEEKERQEEEEEEAPKTAVETEFMDSGSVEEYEDGMNVDFYDAPPLLTPPPPVSASAAQLPAADLRSSDPIDGICRSVPLSAPMLLLDVEVDEWEEEEDVVNAAATSAAAPAPAAHASTSTASASASASALDFSLGTSSGVGVGRGVELARGAESRSIDWLSMLPPATEEVVAHSMSEASTALSFSSSVASAPATAATAAAFPDTPALLSRSPPPFPSPPLPASASAFASPPPSASAHEVAASAVAALSTVSPWAELSASRSDGLAAPAVTTTPTTSPSGPAAGSTSTIPSTSIRPAFGANAPETVDFTVDPIVDAPADTAMAAAAAVPAVPEPVSTRTRSSAAIPAVDSTDDGTAALASIAHFSHVSSPSPVFPRGVDVVSPACVPPHSSARSATPSPVLVAMAEAVAAAVPDLVVEAAGASSRQALADTWVDTLQRGSAGARLLVWLLMCPSVERVFVKSERG